MDDHTQQSPSSAGWRPLATAAGLALAVGAVSAAPGFIGWSPPSASAAITVNPVAAAQGFNSISEGDTYLAGTEAEGPVAVGGDLSFASQYRVRIHDDNRFVDGDETTPVAVLVQGRIDFASSGPSAELSVPTDSYLKIGSLEGAEVHTTDTNDAMANTRVTPAGSGYEGTPRVQLSTMQPADSVGPRADLLDFEQAYTDFRAISAGLALCDTTVTLTDANGNPIDPNAIPPGTDLHVHLTPGRQNVLDISGEDLNTLSGLTIDDQATADTPLVINVDTSGTGGEFTWAGPTPAGVGSNEASFMLWNFPGASAVTIPAGVDTVEGTIYAPDADLAHFSSANLEGTVVTRTFEQVQGGGTTRELHYHPFATDVTTCDADPSPSPTPSPTEPPSPSPSPTEPPSPSPSPTEPPSPTPTDPGYYG